MRYDPDRTETERSPSAPAAPMAVTPSGPLHLPPGHTIGRYEIIRLLGRGGMGEVYQARDLRLARLVAIKFLSKSTPAVRARFLLEARTTARCIHENIGVIHEVGEHDGCPYLVLEHLEGQTLRTWWTTNTEPVEDDAYGDARTRLSPRRVVELMVPVVRALACAHTHGIVHRDLKPENIMLTAAGTTKVLDFGIAKDLDESAPWLANSGPVRLPPPGPPTDTSGLIGTIPYVARTARGQHHRRAHRPLGRGNHPVRAIPRPSPAEPQRVGHGARRH
ncbi:serine/threonine-protein kinase [Haliangium sp.]|uniref:serine/threonine-protein kinase n=1 Tax=Haliangium sp. TaxID=2663208 RepID=UPI003D09BA8C